jgi:hypothetical protein
MRRLLQPFALAVLLTAAAPAASYAQQSFNMYIGGFTPISLEARDQSRDVLVANDLFLSTLNRSAGIDINQFNNVTFGGEWLFGLGRYLDGGLGVGFYQRTVPVADTKNFDTVTGGDIIADLKLRIVPFSATLRFLPLGHSDFQPYIGGGINIYAWHYAESGRFVDYSSCDATGCDIVQGNFSDSGGATGPVVLGGIRFPVGAVRLGGEIRWQGGTAHLRTDQGFAGDRISLGGTNYLFTVDIPF